MKSPFLNINTCICILQTACIHPPHMHTHITCSLDSNRPLFLRTIQTWSQAKHLEIYPVSYLVFLYLSQTNIKENLSPLLERVIDSYSFHLIHSFSKYLWMVLTSLNKFEFCHWKCVCCFVYWQCLSFEQIQVDWDHRDCYWDHSLSSQPA